jgi:alpha-L-rhamnosidase
MGKKINSGKVAVVRLTCEYLVDPIGIDIMKPRLIWELVSSGRGTMQTAYQIAVAATEKDLKEKNNWLWDSGKVSSAYSVHCEYDGPALQSRKRYFWMVRIWDEKDAVTAWSNIARWEMGLLHPEDWKAKWVEPHQRPVQKEKKLSIQEALNWASDRKDRTYEELNPCPMLRKQFTAGSQIKSARIYATAHGIYSIELNGNRISNEFAPDFTAYDKYLQVQTYDVTDQLVPGNNVIGAILADGWYAGRIGLTGDSCNYGDRLALLLQMEIEYTDGSTETVISDHQFKAATGPLLYSDIFIGERYDARLENQGWSNAGYDDSQWEQVNTVDYGDTNLVAQYGEPVRAVQEIRPVKVLTTPKGETVVDLGQNIAGRMRMKVNGPSGTVVTLEHSETLDEHGNFLMNIMGRNKDQQDVYVLKGGGAEIYEPRFTFHGFRYVKVTGYPGQATTDDFTGVALCSDMAISGGFECSDARINQLQSNILWSQKGNMLSIPTDCPQRERAGWTGDLQIFAATACFNMNMAAFLTRWLRNLALEQEEDGQVPIVIPYPQNYRLDYISSAGWGDACVIVPWVLYNKYGDLRILQTNYATMARWVAYIEKTAAGNIPANLDGELGPGRKERQKYLWNTGFHFGDWLTPSVSIDFETGNVDMMKSALATMDLVPTFFYAYSTELMSKIAGLLGKKDEAQRYEELNRKIREAFASEYLDKDGRLKTNLQGMCVLALKLNMVPDQARDQVLEQLLALIEQNGDKLDAGFLSAPFLMDVLCENGYQEVARKLFYQTECPSWLYEVERGATTVWETWQAIMPSGKVTNVSYNHYAFGCIGDWMYRVIAGLNADQPGYKHIVIKPEPDERLTYAKASYHSIYGEIVSHWQCMDDKLKLKVKIPPNTTATVWLPGAVVAKVAENGKNITESRDIFSKRQVGDRAVLEIGSGEYSFEYTAKRLV